MKSVTSRKNRKAKETPETWSPPRTEIVHGTLGPAYFASLQALAKLRDDWAQKCADAGQESEPTKFNPRERKEIQRVKEYLRTSFLDLTRLLRQFEPQPRVAMHLDRSQNPPVSYNVTFESRRPLRPEDLKEIAPPEHVAALVESLLRFHPDQYALPLLNAFSNGFNFSRPGSRAVIITEPGTLQLGR